MENLFQQQFNGSSHLAIMNAKLEITSSEDDGTQIRLEIKYGKENNFIKTNYNRCCLCGAGIFDGCIK